MTQPTQIIAPFLLIPLLTACGGQKVDPPSKAVAPGELVSSDKTRITNPMVAPEDAETLAQDNTRFALEVFQQIRDEQKNLFFSPHSISIALAMTYAGARTTTEAEMEEVVELRLGQEKIHSAFNQLDLSLLARNHDGFLLRIVNQLFGRVGAYFEPAFLDLLAEQYGAAMRLMDFVGDSEGCRQEINDWVAEMTEDRIQDLLPSGIISGDTRLVLVNAIYFLADWAQQFDEATTQDKSFHAPTGDVVAPFMSQLGDFAYVDGDGYRAVELPYDGNEAAMLILIPDAGEELGALESRLTPELLDQAIGGLALTSVQLNMPKFEFTTPLPLRQTLIDMGMVESFTPFQADFSGISGPEYPLYISDVVHKAFIKVDEEGTEAAAATAVVVSDASVPMADVTLTLDQPFLFLIRDKVTDAVLFVGHVINPVS